MVHFASLPRAMQESWRDLALKMLPPEHDQTPFHLFAQGKVQFFVKAAQKTRPLGPSEYKNCFMNVLRYKMEVKPGDASFKAYFGKVIFEDIPLWIDHAWIVDKHGQVIDSTGDFFMYKVTYAGLHISDEIIHEYATNKQFSEQSGFATHSYPDFLLQYYFLGTIRKLPPHWKMWLEKKLLDAS